MITRNELKSIIYYEPDTGNTSMICTSTYVPPAGITYRNGQMYLRINGKNYSMRKLIWLYMTGEWRTGHIYSISCFPEETRWDFLTDDQSLSYRRTMAVSRRSKSGHTGISYNTTRKYWVVRVKVKGESRYVGSYKDLGDAIAAKKRSEMFL